MTSKTRHISMMNIAIGATACLAVVGIGIALGASGGTKTYATAELPSYVLSDLEGSGSTIDLKTVEKQHSTSEGSVVWTARGEDDGHCVLVTVEKPGVYTMTCTDAKQFEAQGTSTGFVPTAEEGSDTDRIEAYLLPDRVDVKSAEVPGLEAVGSNLLVGSTQDGETAKRYVFKTTEGESFVFYPVGSALAVKE